MSASVYCYFVVVICLFVLICQPGSVHVHDLSFIKTPGVVRTDVNKENVRFRWTIDKPVILDSGKRIDYKYGTIKICSVTSVGVKGYTAFKDRVSCFKSSGGLEWGFDFLTPHENFTEHNFTMNISRTMFKSEHFIHVNSDAALFIYREPYVEVDYPSNITKGDSVNITCRATSTSLPAKYRLPITLTWIRPITNLSASALVIGGSDEETLTRITVDEIQTSHVDIACTAKEDGSMKPAIKKIHFDVKDCIGSCEEEQTSPLDDTTLVVNAKLAWILGGIVLVILLVLLIVIGYLVWEKKNRPDRSRRRSMAVRMSLGRQLPITRRGRRNMKNDYGCPESVSIESNSDNYYAEIPNSRVTSTIDGNAVPALPERMPDMKPVQNQEDAGCYDYADARLIQLKLNHGAAPNRTNRIRESAIYGEDGTERQIKIDVDGYMDTTDMEMHMTKNNNKKNASHDTAVKMGPPMDEYAVVDKAKKAPVSSPEAYDVVECPAYIPMTEVQANIVLRHSMEQDGGSKQCQLLGSTNEDNHENQPINDVDTGDAYCEAGNIRSDSLLLPGENEPVHSDLYNRAEAVDECVTKLDMYDLEREENHQEHSLGMYDLEQDENRNEHKSDLYDVDSELEK